MSPRRVCRVAVPAPLRTLFDYLPPVAGLPPAPGQRVRVPFGRGERCGVVLELAEDADSGRPLKPVSEALDDAPLLREADLGLLRWAARYYQHPIGEVIAAALPVRLRQGRMPAGEPGGCWRLTPLGLGQDSGTPARAPRQAKLMELLRAAGGSVCRTDLEATGEGWTGALRALRARGWVDRAPVAVGPRVPGVAGPPLNDAQMAAVAAVRACARRFGAFLLDGVTGSGKTEVYLALVREVVAAGGQALVLVPEIGLTPQLVDRFRQRSGARLAVLHSGLAEGERERGWLAAREGLVDVVIGTRSAVFTPLPRLGIVVVDEEHDPSLKQQEGFRYSARDLAVVLAQRRACPVVLGSATPSLESLRNADLGRYRRLLLPARAGAAVAPRVDLVDLRSVPLEAGLAPTTRRIVRETLERGEQVLLFLNRRGYAPVVTCHACGWVAGCRRCDARMTFHAATGLLWCHHCGSQRPRDRCCPQCGGTELLDLGLGTERLEESVGRLYAGYDVVRVDRDSTRRKGELERSLEAVRAGRVPLLLGTQMLAKGHDFPGVTLVVVIDSDQGLHGADFRSAERMAQLITQVAGRAGRAARPGRVLIQTHHPDHPLLQVLVREGYGAFARAALAERAAAGLPPYSHQVLWRAEATKAEPSTRLLEAVARRVRSDAPPGLEVWGPVPAPMERRAGRYRTHLLLQAPDRAALHGRLAVWVEDAAALPEARRARWSVDVDPQDVL
jgi:primosomal protein N' (replication factor Y)